MKRPGHYRYNVSQPWQGQAQPAPEPPPPDATKTPARPAGIASDVAVPLLQAGITGLLLGGLIALAAKALGAPVDGWQLWGVLALSFVTVAWMVLLLDTRKLLRVIEERWGVDLDGDGQIGQPERIRHELTVTVQLDKNHRKIIDTENLGIDAEQLILFARGIVAGRDFTEGTWGGEKAIFASLPKFRQVLAALEKDGIIERVNPGASNSTYRRTRPGRRFFEEVAGYSLTHTHAMGSRVQDE